MAEIDPALAEKLKSTLWFQIGKIVDEETLNLGVHATPQYIGSLAELVWAQIGSTATDLESFARHRKGGGKSGGKSGGTVVRVEDVLLLGRRNEGLEGILREEVGKIQERKEKT